MPVQNSNSNISGFTDLATNLLQMLIPAMFDSLLCQKGQLTLKICPISWFVRKIFGSQKSKLKDLYRDFCLFKKEVFVKPLSKRKARQVMAKSLLQWRSTLDHSAIGGGGGDLQGCETANSQWRLQGCHLDTQTFKNLTLGHPIFLVTNF